jgi:phosphoribosyl 1,2-cyclic phosphate phosphodiesterase
VKLTFLGTGTSFGVPVIGCDCNVCASSDSRDKRSRVGALVESKSGTRILIDTPPELRAQLLGAKVSSVDAVLYTHDHADHTHGIDDIRAITMQRRGSLPVYSSADVLERLGKRFPYIFDPAVKIARGPTRPEAEAHVVVPGCVFRIGDVDVLPLAVPHGDITVLGFRFGQIGYVTDAKEIPADVRDQLRGLKVLVLNALLRKEHPTHLSIPEAVDVARSIGAEQTYFTHLTHRESHAALQASLPDGIAPAYDGFVVETN